MNAARLRLPTEDNIAQVFGTFHAAMWAFGQDLGSRYDAQLTQTVGPTWFQDLRAQRPRERRPKNKWDITFVVNEPLFNAQSPTRSCLPVGKSFYDNLAKINSERNAWAHYDTTFNFTRLTTAMGKLLVVATAIPLPVAEEIRAVVQRIEDVAAGRFQPVNQVEAKKWTSIDPDLAPDVQVETKRSIRHAERIERPRIGEAWLGPLPERHLRVFEGTLEVFDVETLQSVRAELGDTGRADQVIRLWCSYVGNNNDVYVAADGAVAGQVAGTMCLIGYMGELPGLDREQVQGFLRPGSYRRNGPSIVGSEPGQVVGVSWNEEALVVPDGQLGLRLSSFGDVALFDELESRWVKVGTAETPNGAG